MLSIYIIQSKNSFANKIKLDETKILLGFTGLKERSVGCHCTVEGTSPT